MGKERRKYIRFECLLPVEVTKVEGVNGLSEKSRIEDFSRSGLKLILNLDFDFVPGSKLDLNCSMPGKTDAETASAEVIWSRKEGNRWELGLRIFDMAPQTRCEILDTCYAKWQEKKKKQV
jgi:hypothetical protein